MCFIDKKKKGIGFEKRTASQIGFGFGLRVRSRMAARAVTFLVVSEPRFRRFYKMILKFFL